ncbi:MAG: tetratricopeptide repeat protein [Beutenbergiaceae bacterium]
MSQPPSGLNLRGAVDLSTLSQPQASPSADMSGAIIEVTTQTFQNLVTTSAAVPVVVDLYSSRSAASTELSATLQALTTEFGGRFQLARIDADAHPQIAQAVGAQSLPTTFAIIKGQPVPLFQGAHPPEQVKAVLEELLRVAAQNGVTGTVEVPQEAEQPAEPQEPPLPPHLEAAYDAISAGDLAAAAQVLADALKQNPADAEAKAGLAQVDLMRRLDGVDADAALAAAESAAPSDVPAQLLGADVEVSRGVTGSAYRRLLESVRATTGPQREEVRERLVELFLLAVPDDPEVLKARRELAIALY